MLIRGPCDQMRMGSWASSGLSQAHRLLGMGEGEDKSQGETEATPPHLSQTGLMVRLSLDGPWGTHTPIPIPASFGIRWEEMRLV